MICRQDSNYLTMNLSLHTVKFVYWCSCMFEFICCLSQGGAAWRLKLYSSSTWRNEEQQPKSLRAQTLMAAVRDRQIWLGGCRGFGSTLISKCADSPQQTSWAVPQNQSFWRIDPEMLACRYKERKWSGKGNWDVFFFLRQSNWLLNILDEKKWWNPMKSCGS